MPPIRSLVSKRRLGLVSLILSLGEIMPSCFYYVEKRLVCIIIMSLANRQPSSYSKYIKANTYLSCNMRLVPFNKCRFPRYARRYVY